MTKLIGIAYKAEKRGPMLELQQTSVSCEAGIIGDVRGKPGPRQVTLVSQQQWQHACAQLGLSLSWLSRRANLLVDDYNFSSTDIGKQLQIGKLTLLITGETAPCNRMDDAASGLKQLLTGNYLAGVTCQVVTPGEIAAGDKVDIS